MAGRSRGFTAVETPFRLFGTIPGAGTGNDSIPLFISGSGGDAMRLPREADEPFFSGAPGLFSYVGSARQAPMMP